MTPYPKPAPPSSHSMRTSRPAEVELTSLAGPTGQCFVCFEEGAPASRCACTDRYLHAECKVKMVETGRFGVKCSVCLQEYEDVQLIETRRFTKLAKVIVVLTLVWFGLVGVTIWRSYVTW